MPKRLLRAFTSIFLLAFLVIGTRRPALADGYIYVTQWGGPGGNGNGQVWQLFDVAVDASGYVYVADTGNHRIEEFASTGTYISQWGTAGSGDGQFIQALGVAVDASGNVYVVDNNLDRIQKFTSSGTYITQWGGTGSGDGQLSNPYDVAVDTGGYVYVADPGNQRIEKFTDTGAYVTQWSTGGTVAFAVTADPEGSVYVAGLGPIQKFTNTGTYITQWGTPGSGDGQFSSAPAPHGVAADASGNVYVADTGNNRIQKFTSTGTYMTQWGTPGTGDGQFNDPSGLAVDASGCVYVADFNNNRVQKFEPASLVSVPGEAPIAFALDPVRPDPVHGRALTVQFTLASAAPASLELLDVAGRRVSAREVGRLGPGRHVVDLGAGRSLAPGIYLVRLQQGSNLKVTRAAVLH